MITITIVMMSGGYGQKNCTHKWSDGHGFRPQTSTNAHGHICKYVDHKGSAAILTSIQSTGVAPELNLRITQARKYEKDLPWL